MTNLSNTGGGADIIFTFQSLDYESFNVFLERNRESIQLELERAIKSGEDRHRKAERRQVEELRHIGEHGVCEVCGSAVFLQERADGTLYFAPIS